MKTQTTVLLHTALLGCVIAVLAFGSLHAQVPVLEPWTVPVSVQGPSTIPLEFGTKDGCTDGFTAGCDAVLPPPGFNFYSAFNIPGPVPFLSKDFRSPQTTPNNWSLVVQNAIGVTYNICWDSNDFPAGDVPGVLTMSVPGVGDVNMLNPPANCVQVTGNTTITIHFEAPASVERLLSISDATANEGDGTMTFTATISSTSASPVTVDFSTTDGSAVAPGDYTATSGTLTIPPGLTSGTINVPIINDGLDENDETFTVNLSNAVNATIADGQGIGTILDNDPPPSLSISEETDNEDAGTMSFTVTLSVASGKPVSVDFATANGTAVAPGDYTATTGTLAIPAGSTTGTINVPIVDDGLDENDETFTVNLSNAVNASIADGQGTGTILDNDPAPSLSISDESESENVGTMSFTVTLSAASGRSVSVDFATSNGTAVAPGDYTATSGTLTIPAGNATGTINVPIINDGLDENDETFTVNLSNAVNATIADGQGVGTIVDDDPPPSLVISDESENENVGTMSFTVTLSAASGKSISLDFATSDGTAIAPGDYTATSGTLTIPAGSTTGTINVPIIDDAIDENNETFNVNLSNAVNATIADAQGVGTIVDNDGVTLSISDETENENVGTMSFTVTLSGASASVVSVSFATSNGTAVAPGDYTAASGTLNIPAGNTTGTIDVAISDDANDENNETFTVNLSNPVNADIADGQGVGTINDNDDPPSLAIADKTDIEAVGMMTFTVSLSAASGKSISVDFATSNGTAVAPGDYTATSGTLTIPAGNTTGTIDVPIINDGLDENDETFTVDLSNAVNATIADGQGLGTILDDDPPPSLSISDESESENVGTMSFTVALSAASAKQVSVDFTTTNGTAVAPGDYTATSGTLSIPAGSTTGAINVPIIDDAIDENNETFSVNLTNAVNANLADAQGIGTIIDNDGVALSIGDKTESEDVGTMSFTVTLSGASASVVSVNFATSNGTAVAPEDYTATSGTLNIPAGNTTGTINVPIVNDGLDENNETFTVNLSNPVNADIADGQGVGTINDNDEPPSLAIGDKTDNEAVGTMSFTVSLSTASGKSVSVDFATSNGTAVAPGDYTATSGTLNIPAGSTTGTINVPIINDGLDENDETFTVNLSNAVNAAIADAQGLGTIVDNDGAPSLSISDEIESENVGTMSFTVTLSAASGIPVSVDFATANGTAVAPGDYTATSGTLTIPAGNTSGTINVAIIDDGLDETDESFTVGLSNAINATIADNQGAGTIRDNDGEFCELAVNPTAWDFGEVQGFEEKTFVLSNADDATEACVGTASILGDDEFQIWSGSSFAIPPGDEHQLVVRITCGDQPGDYGATLRLVSNDPDVIDVPLTGECLPPAVDFTGVPNTGGVPLTVTFEVITTQVLTSYQWNFGDGSTSTLSNPTHVYVDPGCYTVTLVVYGPLGQTTVSKTDYVCANPCANIAQLSLIESSYSYPGETWDNAFDGDVNDWDGTVTTNGNPPFALFALDSAAATRINKLRILTDTGVGFEQRWAQRIVVSVSNSGVDPDDFTQILDQQLSSGDWTEFAFPTTMARYLKLVLNSPGADGWVQLGEFEVFKAIAGQVDAQESSVQATTPHVANGLDRAVITITLRNVSGASMSGLVPNDFRVLVSGSGNTVSPVTETSTSGTYRFEVASTRSETKSLRVLAQCVELEELTVRFTQPVLVKLPVDFVQGSPAFTGEGWYNATDGDVNDWDGTVTTRGSLPFGIFEFSDHLTHAIGSFRLLTDTNVGFSYRWVKKFRLAVSTTGLDEADFTTILDANKTGGSWESFNFPLAAAKYVKIIIDQPISSDGWRQLGELEIYGEAFGLAKGLVETNDSQIPTAYSLSQNYPNPFNPQTVIEFGLPEAGQTRLVIYDLQGRVVRRLLDQQLPAGIHSVVWDGIDALGQRLSSGIYLYRLDSGSFVQIKRMTLMK